MSRGYIESFVESRVAWIEEQRGKIGHARFQIHLEYVDGEKVFFLGEEYILHVFEGKGKMRVENMIPLSSSSAFPTLKELALFVPSGSTRAKREAVVEGWYREELRNMIGVLVTHWEPILSVRVKEYGVKKMKTRWGTCSI